MTFRDKKYSINISLEQHWIIYVFYSFFNILFEYLCTVVQYVLLPFQFIYTKILVYYYHQNFSIITLNQTKNIETRSIINSNGIKFRVMNNTNGNIFLLQ